jgi:hypothetical protein
MTPVQFFLISPDGSVNKPEDSTCKLKIMRLAPDDACLMSLA